MSRSHDSIDSLASDLSNTHLSPQQEVKSASATMRKLSAPSPVHRLSASAGSSSSPPSSAHSSSSASRRPIVRALPGPLVAGHAWRGRRRPNRLTANAASTSASLLRARGQARKKRKDSRSDEPNTPSNTSNTSNTTHSAHQEDTAEALQARIQQLQSQLARLNKVANPPTTDSAAGGSGGSVVVSAVEMREEWAEELDSAPFMEVTEWNFYGLENSGPSSASDSEEEEDSEEDEDEDEDEDGVASGVVSALKKMMNFGGSGVSRRVEAAEEEMEEEREDEEEDEDEEARQQQRRSRQRQKRRQEQRRKRSDSRSEEEKRSGDDSRDSADTVQQTARGEGSPAGDKALRLQRREESKEDLHDEESERGKTAVHDEVKEGELPGEQHDGSESEFNIASSPGSSNHSAQSQSHSHSPSATSGSSAMSSSRSSFSSSSSVSSVHSTTDRFPYERNILALQPHYFVLRRLYACQDAVTYKAVARVPPPESQSPLVVLKVADGYSGKKDPKEVRLLTAVQGHPRICKLVGWHPLLSTECSAMVTVYIQHSEIEATVMLSRRKQQIYMLDLLSALQHMHARNVLYRDIKPSNVLWSEADEHATVIDFDVATFYSGERRHRSVVGTDGYLSTEILRIHAEKKRRRQERKEREEAEAEDEEEAEDHKGEEGEDGHDGDIEGYGFATDVYSAGVVLAQLLFRVNEDDVADLDRHDTKGPAFVRRCKRRLREVSEDTRDERQRPGLELCVAMLTDDPEARIGVSEALAHEFFSQRWTAEEDKVEDEEDEEEEEGGEGEDDEVGEEEQGEEAGGGSDEDGSVDEPGVGSDGDSRNANKHSASERSGSDHGSAAEDGEAEREHVEADQEESETHNRAAEAKQSAAAPGRSDGGKFRAYLARRGQNKHSVPRIRR